MSITISIDDALKRAFWYVKLPSLLVLLLPLLSCILLEEKGYLPPLKGGIWIWFILLMFTSLVGGWLVWAIQVPRWRLWAYKRVENIEELKKVAINKQLIWPEENILSKTEIASNDVWNQIKQLESLPK